MRITHKADKHALTSATFVALKSNYLLVISAHLAPVGNLAGIDVLDLLAGQRVDGVVLVHKEYESLVADLRVIKGIFAGNSLCH